MGRLLQRVGILLRIILILYATPQNSQAECINDGCNTTTTDCCVQVTAELNPIIQLQAHPKSTTSVKVEWSVPDGAKPCYDYRVQTTDISGTTNSTVKQTQSNSTVVTDLQPGTGYYFNVTVVAPGCESAVEQALNYTMPKAVTNLTAVYVNTTAVQLSWLKQDDFKPGYSYQVTVLGDGQADKPPKSTTTENYTATSLTPGESYTFQVLTVVQGVRSTVETTTSHTKPGRVSELVALGNTTAMYVSWKAASGQVEYYSVLLHRDSQLEQNQSRQSNATLSVWFVNLNPGTLYGVQVFTMSGPLSDSVNISNATFPNPPGLLKVESQTTDSINVTWSLPEGTVDMNFTVFHLNHTQSTERNWLLLGNLQSGTLYNISVVTVGPLGYQSTMVTTRNSTRPLPVSELTQIGIAPGSLVLTWSQPDVQPDYSYLVDVSHSADGPNTTSETTYNVSGLLSGGNYSCTVTTQTADGTSTLSPVTKPCFTQPNAVSELKAFTLNATAIHLRWEKPQQYQNTYTYRVEASGCISRNVTVANESAEMAALWPGTKCKLCVLTRSEAGIEGEARCTDQYTEPQRVQPTVSNEGSSDTIVVSWEAPAGGVERYVVHLNSSYNTSDVTLDPTQPTSHRFTNLLPGREYAAMVITVSGPFKATSGRITNATFPNPPGPIKILTKTTSSIGIEWQDAHLMAGASFQYVVTYNHTQSNFTTGTNHTFSYLLSGTPYNISVATVGPLDLRSDNILISVTTKPESVTSLNATTEEEAILLTWAKPGGYKPGYRYNVKWGRSGGPINDTESIETTQEKLNASLLVPGSSYNFSVITVTFDDTQSDAMDFYNCTNTMPRSSCFGPDPRAGILASY